MVGKKSLGPKNVLAEKKVWAEKKFGPKKSLQPVVIIEIKANSVQLKLKLGLSLAIKNKCSNVIGMEGYKKSWNNNIYP